MTDQERRIDVSAIVVADRLRAIDEATVGVLAESIKTLGLRTPVTLRRDGDALVLVAGAHRLEAVKRLGWTRIEATIVEGWSELEAIRWEIAENLHRADLTALQRDEQIAEWIRVTDAILSQLATVSPAVGGRGKEGGGRKAAREIGVDKDSVHRAIKVAGLTAEAKRVAREEGLDNNHRALIAASRAEPEQQAGVLRNWRNENVAQLPSRATRIDADVKDRAAQAVAELIAEYIPADAWDGLKVNLYSAGASAIAVALVNLGA